MVMRAGLLMEGGGEGQFLGRREGRGLQRGKTGVRKGSRADPRGSKPHS